MESGSEPVERRRKASITEGRAFALLATTYLLWTAIVAVAEAGNGCSDGLLCRLSGSGRLSTLVIAPPLALILGSLWTRRRDESARLFAIATVAAILLVLPRAAATLASGVYRLFG